jgi:hypothetical protein
MKHKIIKTGNYLLIVDDSEIKEGDYACHKNKKYREDYPNENHIVKCNKKHIFPDGNTTLDEHWRKIIAHLPLNPPFIYGYTDLPILEGVDLLPPLEDDEAICPYPEEKQNAVDWHNGYNKAKEKYNKPIPEWIYSSLCAYDKRNPGYIIYDEDNLSARPTDCYCDSCFYGKTKLAEFIIKSLQQPKYPVAFECEIEVCVFGNHTHYDPKIEDYVKPKTTTNSEGQTVWVGKYTY